MLGWGIQYWGIDYWGGIGPTLDEGFGEFQFRVVAMSQGYTIKVTLTTPDAADSPQWSRRFMILRKSNEWSQAVDDTNVFVISDVVDLGSTEYSFLDPDLVAGKDYYYRLFLLGTDGIWYSSRAEMDSAYPYERWGSAKSMYMSLPRGWRSHDETQDLYNFVEMFGAVADNLKTDCEYLKTLFSIYDVHEDLLPIADSKIGWPTWIQAGGVHKRRDSANAVETYKRLGTEYGYSQLFASVTDWEFTLTSGWKYLFWSNSAYSTTPDLTDPDLLADVGGVGDLLRYTNDPSRWQSYTGLGFYLTEIPGVTGPFTQAMWDRILFLIEWGKASYVVYEVRIVPISEEEYLADWVLDEALEPLIAFIERSVSSELDEEDAPYSPDLLVFTSNTAVCITNTDYSRVWHSYLSFDFPP